MNEEKNSSLECLLQQAYKLSLSYRHKYLLPEHVLYALLENSNIKEIINKCGGDAQEIINELNTYFNSNHVTRLNPVSKFFWSLFFSNPALPEITQEVTTLLVNATSHIFNEVDLESDYFLVKVLIIFTTEKNLRTFQCFTRQNITDSKISTITNDEHYRKKKIILEKLNGLLDSGVKHFLNTSSLKKIEIENLSYRSFNKKDIKPCLSIYKAIEKSGAIPTDNEELYIDWLKGHENRKFVILKDDKIIASCGFRETDGCMYLTYGLIEPNYQRKGLGSLMLALRAIQLKDKHGFIVLSPTQLSSKYYARYGFRDLEDSKRGNFDDLKNLPIYDKNYSLNDNEIEKMLLYLNSNDIEFMQIYFDRAFK